MATEKQIKFIKHSFFIEEFYFLSNASFSIFLHRTDKTVGAETRGAELEDCRDSEAGF